MYVHTPSKSLILKVRDPFMIRELLPDASRTVALPDGHNIQVRWNLDTARLLNNLGIQAPSPIKSFYRFPRPPHYQLLDHQVEMASFSTLNDKLFNLSEMGTGKTAATLWAMDFLMEIGELTRALILCPLSSMKATWAKDIFEVLPHRTCTILHGSWQRRLKNLNRKCDFYIMNHDGIDIEKMAVALRGREDIQLIVVDEADAFCNSKTDHYRFLKWVAERKTKLWMITGSPCPNQPTDAWGLSKLVCPQLSPRYFSEFRDETMAPTSMHKWAPKQGAQQRAFEIMQPAIRYRKKDCLTLPPLVGPREVITTLSQQQRDALDSMRNEMTMFAAENEITAVNGADKINKLRQILCGSVKDPNTGEYHLLDCHARVRDLRRVITSASAKVLVIAPFKGIVRHLVEELPKPDKHGGLPGVSCLMLNGDVPPAKRPEIIDRFKTDPFIKALICHPRVMSHGLNFTEADTTIFYGPIYSNREYSQVIERFNRLGQVNTMFLLRMLAHPIEASIYSVVDARGSMQLGILDLYKQFVSGGDEL